MVRRMYSSDRSFYGEHYAGLEAQRHLIRQHGLLHTHMSCWHLSEVESAAMWDLYQREGRGVAIRSTWHRLTTSITDHRVVYGGKIEYVDYDSTFISEQNAFAPFLCKRRSFAHEQEARLMCATGLEGGPAPGDPNSRLAGGPEPAVITVTADLDVMIEAIHVAPQALDWIYHIVESVARKYGVAAPIERSDLDRDPIA